VLFSGLPGTECRGYRRSRLSLHLANSLRKSGFRADLTEAAAIGYTGFCSGGSSMGKCGRVFPSEMFAYRDPETGAEIVRLTGYRGHSHHAYFTVSGWYDSNRRLLFASERENRINLFSLELASGEITQLTDFPELPAGSSENFFSLSRNPQTDEAYFWFMGQLLAVNLSSLASRVLAEVPHGFRAGNTDVTADGRSVCTVFAEDLSSRIGTDLLRGYVGFRETWQARPICRIAEIPVCGGALRTVYEEKYWVGHINASPTQAGLLTFCHEGPWHEVDHRIHGLDLATGRTWRIRPGSAGERIGHEYWLEDGVTIGYHGWPDKVEKPYFGFIRHDNTARREHPVPAKSMHYNSRNGDTVVGDGWGDDPCLRVWRRNGAGYDRPRLLCRHRSSFHIQQAHPHPCIAPDGRSVLFTSDHLGYCNLHLAALDTIDALPFAGTNPR
jgi:oligogalacturonide lyase